MSPPTLNFDTRFRERFRGEIHTGETLRRLYATDASAYRELPQAVVFPETEGDLAELIRFANTRKLPLIPRTAGTSLAGQVVGSGIVVDVSRHFTEILNIDVEKREVTLQPGVVRDELNLALKPYGLLFGPETSTSNRAMMGGMVGNNSCGSNSLIYGNTRDHLVRVKGILSDGSPVVFEPLSEEDFEKKCNGAPGLEGEIYRHISKLLSEPEKQEEITRNYPKPSIKRRNTGYALDQLLACKPFREAGPDFNFCRLIAGSEGTLCFITEITLTLDSLSTGFSALVCGHFNSIIESLHANNIALRHNARACELIDKIILDCTKSNIEQNRNRFFIKGDPEAILVMEIAGDSESALQSGAEELIRDLQQAGLGYHYPVLTGDDIPKIWNLRKAGLGLLSTIPGDSKPVAVIEDTAVDPLELPDYIGEYDQILNDMGLKSVYYAHAGSGELHIRPILDLKSKKGQQQFREVAERVAALVKRYRGSLSGEHGDGRLRGEFIAFMMGEKITRWFEDLKSTWDPHAIFNPGKIVNTPPMDTHLRYEKDQSTPKYDTYFDFSANRGIVRAAEMCNGSGDCRKSFLSGGTMCPSYQATRREMDTTRARANILREILSRSSRDNPFDSPEIHEVMDLCLSCKGCKSECPSNVDVARLKAEFLQHYHDANGASFRTRFFSHFEKNQRRASRFAPLANWITTTPGLARIPKAILGIHPKRSIPKVAGTTLRSWINKHPEQLNPKNPGGRTVILFVDEFTNYLDVSLGIAAIRLLTRLGYRVECPRHPESGRAALSKGMVRLAREKIEENIKILAPAATLEKPLLGIEPSTILTFRDEAPDLARGALANQAKDLAGHTFLIDEFLAAEMDAGAIHADAFTRDPANILLHGHCHQKALSSVNPSKRILEFPVNYSVKVIPSGCCGMAGSFGYEKEHYQLSMDIGNMVLLPAITGASEDSRIAAPGTSCRHQIFDGTGKQANHPLEILLDALSGETTAPGPT